MFRRREIRITLGIALLAAILWAAAETIRPTSIASQSGYTDCTVGEIDEDVDSSGTDWCDTADGTNTATDVRVEMGDPTNPPTATASAQEVRVQLRKTNHTTNPTCTVDITEGATVRVDNIINAVTVTATTEQVESATWTWVAADWTDKTGASIAVDVACAVGGGSPGNRANGEVGAIELNLDTAPAAVRNRAVMIE